MAGILRRIMMLVTTAVLGSAVAAESATYTPQPYVKLTHPAWAETAVIYELNTRQFTREGTLAAAMRELPRLKAMGIGIVWLMPIQPIGVEHRKGSLGSPYAVRDYRAVNPEFGTLADLRAFVAAAHGLGLHVILDWVGNHSAWDNPLHAAHPDWYKRDWKGANRPTLWWDWSDIIDLDYSQPGLRRYMTEAMKYWVTAADVDGFRCDVAGYVPLDFWETARAELDRVKPVFMLAEYDQRDMHARAFDATYAWKWNNALADIAAGKADVGALIGYYSENRGAWPDAAMRMVYTENHDQNSWESTAAERFGPALDNAITLSFVGEGIPLIHNGQEAGNPRRLAFFEHDPIDWRPHPNAALFTRLIAFRRAHPALSNAPWGARMTPVVNSAPKAVLSFVRSKGADKLLALFNFSAQPQTVTLSDGPVAGHYRDALTGVEEAFDPASRVTLAPWSNRLLVGVP